MTKQGEGSAYPVTDWAVGCDSGQWAMDSGRAVDSEQWALDFGHCAVDSGQ